MTMFHLEVFSETVLLFQIVPDLSPGVDGPELRSEGGGR